jgi:asparagine synthase (glutamine-hydrolysing)
MIFGICEPGPERAGFSNRLADIGRMTGFSHNTCTMDGGFRIAFSAGSRTGSRHAGAPPVVSEEKGLAAVFTGALFNMREIEGYVRDGGRNEAFGNPSSMILSLYERFGTDFANLLNGSFAFAVWDQGRQRLVIGRDHMGVEPLYYCHVGDRLAFSSRMRPILRALDVRKEISPQALGKYLLFNYNPGTETIFRGIRRLRPAHLLVMEQGRIEIRRYWMLSFRNGVPVRERDAASRLLQELRKAVRIRVEGVDAPGIFLSGGIDSSTVAAFSAEACRGPLTMFSYYCRGASFDESRYARFMAKAALGVHVDVEYTGRDLPILQKIAGVMDEPFDDAAINVATCLLGRVAGGRVSCVLTGDGGDELFGGHPVYGADRIALYIDSLPGLIRTPVSRLLSRLPDTDKKKSLPVKVKRFFESVSFPGELLSHRWRVYYTVSELRRLLSSDLAEEMRMEELFDDVLRYNREADGPDRLSRCLYSDYQTAVEFSLRRNDLNRAFGLETRFPLLDRNLVELCASLPSRMKIRGWFSTKCILKKALEGVLPHEIVHRRNKLGHSVPLKNWIREDPSAKQFVLSLIHRSVIKRRGFFDPRFVDGLVEEHMAKRRNNSHRLWSLAVLEMWLRENVP